MNKTACIYLYQSLDRALGGTTAEAPPPFRPGEPALRGSRPLVTLYCCRL